MVQCYNEMLYHTDMIAFSFDLSHYEEMADETGREFKNKQEKWMVGRQQFLRRMITDNVINTNGKHHLLGCGLPQEFQFYKHADYKWLYSLDTSNPVVHGIKGIEYPSGGLWTKESQKLFELINEEVNAETLSKIKTNIQRFRWYTNGNEAVDNLF